MSRLAWKAPPEASTPSMFAVAAEAVVAVGEGAVPVDVNGVVVAG
jgi:hypothetical protein